MPASMPQPVSAGPIAEPITIKEVANAFMAPIKRVP